MAISTATPSLVSSARLGVAVLLGAIASLWAASARATPPAVYTQTYSATTAAAGNPMSDMNAATVTVSRTALRDTIDNDGGRGRRFPFDATNTSSRTQMLVEQVEVGYPGVIDSIGWMLHVNQASAVTLQNFQIKLVHTLRNHASPQLSTVFADNYDTFTPVTVFGPATVIVPAHAAGDLFLLDVADVFTYDDVRNLIVEVTWTNPGTGSDAQTRTVDTTGIWNVNGSAVSATGVPNNFAHFFILRFAADSKVVHPYDGSPATVSAGTGSTYLYDALSTQSGAIERWMTNETLGGPVSNAPVSHTFYDQYLPTVTLSGTSSGNTVSTEAHTKFNVSVAAPGQYGVFSDWADRASTLTFSAATTPLGYTTSDPRSFTVLSAFVATIHYSPASSGPAFPILSFRADSANGITHYPIPSAGSPWIDLVGTHDATLTHFLGNLSSGWKGNGTRPSPYRLEFSGEDVGLNDRVTVPAGSIPELQTRGPVTAMMWFKTGFDAPQTHYEYLMEWVQEFTETEEGFGMSIAIQDGKLQVYLEPWATLAELAPNTWYHVAVAKDTTQVRMYVNGQPVLTGAHSHFGKQDSELTLGCSVFRVFEGYPGEQSYGDFFTGSIAQAELWSGILSDSAVFARFASDSTRYLPNAPIPSVAKLVSLRADSANGTGPYAIPGASSPWRDLIPSVTDAVLGGFAGDATSGWQGNGTTGSPYRLVFDGIDDHAAIAAGSIGQLQTVSAVTVGLWFLTGPDVASSQYRYLFEWIQGVGSGCGMSIAIADSKLQVFLANPYWAEVGPVSPNTWYHVAVVKQPGEVRVYLDGIRVYTSTTPMIGDQASEAVIGASTWRGPGEYGEFYKGAIAQVAIWRGALDDAGAFSAYSADAARYNPPTAVDNTPLPLALTGVTPNPTWDRFNVSFTLPSAGSANLELLDISGRRIRSRTIEGLAPGTYSFSLGERDGLHSGVYWVRLSHRGRWVSRKVTVL